MVLAKPNLFAVADLGTNTFHLLVVKKSKDNFDEVYRERVFVNIAEEGIQHIGDPPYHRAKETIRSFSDKLDELGVTEVKVFGTAALRTADNGPQLIHEIKAETGIDIQIIDGKREAELIAKGTNLILDMSVGQYLIMDIGGGSVEFILVDDGDIGYIKSFPLGVTALYNHFNHEEPISTQEVEEIHQYLSNQLLNLRETIENQRIKALVGASGSFEVLELIINGKINNRSCSKFDIADTKEIMDTIIKMDLSQRLAHKSIPNHRAKLIVVAFLLMQQVLGSSSFDKLIVSPFALKEGVISEYLGI